MQSAEGIQFVLLLLYVLRHVVYQECIVKLTESGLNTLYPCLNFNCRGTMILDFQTGVGKQYTILRLDCSYHCPHYVVSWFSLFHLVLEEGFSSSWCRKRASLPLDVRRGLLFLLVSEEGFSSSWCRKRAWIFYCGTPWRSFHWFLIVLN